jgi:hypothetical protein
MKFREKPVVIEAHRVAFDGSTREPLWLVEAIDSGVVWFQGGDEAYYTIKTLEGEMRASRGDWIIRGVKGELYPCKPDIFDATYEAA